MTDKNNIIFKMELTKIYEKLEILEKQNPYMEQDIDVLLNNNNCVIDDIINNDSDILYCRNILWTLYKYWNSHERKYKYPTMNKTYMGKLAKINALYYFPSFFDGELSFFNDQRNFNKLITTLDKELECNNSESCYFILILICFLFFENRQLIKITRVNHQSDQAIINCLYTKEVNRQNIFVLLKKI